MITNENESIKNKIIKLFKNVDWKKYGSLATNSCYHLGKSNIFQVMQDKLSLLR